MYEVFSFVDEHSRPPWRPSSPTNVEHLRVGLRPVDGGGHPLHCTLRLSRPSRFDPGTDPRFRLRAIKLAIIVMLVKNASEYQTYVTTSSSTSCGARSPRR